MTELDYATRYRLSEWDTETLCKELKQRKKDRDWRPEPPNVEFGEMGAWRSFYGQLGFEFHETEFRYHGLLLPNPEMERMGYHSLYETRKAINATGTPLEWEDFH